MTQSSQKTDCQLIVLNSSMTPIDEFIGVIHLFEHEYGGYAFWHGVVDVADVQDHVQSIFAAGQNEDIKIRIELADGRAGLAKQVFLRSDREPPFAHFIQLKIKGRLLPALPVRNQLDGNQLAT